MNFESPSTQPNNRNESLKNLLNSLTEMSDEGLNNALMAHEILAKNGLNRESQEMAIIAIKAELSNRLAKSSVPENGQVTLQ